MKMKLKIKQIISMFLPKRSKIFENITQQANFIEQSAEVFLSAVENWKKINLKIKFRESFRPFAPTVLEEYTRDYFDLDRPSPYMLLVADVHENKRDKIPAVTHVDGSARIQTINRDQNPRYYGLIKAFERKTGFYFRCFFADIYFLFRFFMFQCYNGRHYFCKTGYFSFFV